LNSLKELTLSLAFAGALVCATTVQAAPDHELAGKNVALANGALSDGSNWAMVIAWLKEKGSARYGRANPADVPWRRCGYTQPGVSLRRAPQWREHCHPIGLPESKKMA